MRHNNSRNLIRNDLLSSKARELVVVEVLRDYICGKKVGVFHDKHISFRSPFSGQICWVTESQMSKTRATIRSAERYGYLNKLPRSTKCTVNLVGRTTNAILTRGKAPQAYHEAILGSQVSIILYVSVVSSTRKTVHK